MKDVSSCERSDEVILSGDRNKVAFLFVLVFYWMWFLVFVITSGACRSFLVGMAQKTPQKLSYSPMM